MKLPKGLFLRGSTFYVLYRTETGFSRKSVGKDYQRALAQHASLRRETGPLPAGSPLPLSVLTARYLDKLRTGGKKKSLSFARSISNRLIRELPEHVQDLSPGALQSFVERRIRETSSSTAAADLRVLKAVLNWGVELKLIPAVPFKIRIPKHPKFKVVRPLTPVEIKALLVNSQGWVRGLLLLCAHTGLRTDEALHLQWGDLDLPTGQILVRGKENWSPKSHQARAVFVAPTVLQELSALKSRSPWVFPNRAGKVRDVSAVCRKVREVFEAAGCYEPGQDLIHRLRRSFATALSDQGIDLNLLKELLGHSSLVVTSGYLSVSDKRKKHASVVLADVLK